MLCVFACGAVLWSLQFPGPEMPSPDTSHPVELRGALTRAWTRSGPVWRSRMRVEMYRQSDRLRIWRQEIWLYASSGPKPRCSGQVHVRGFLRRSEGYADLPPIPPGPWRMWLKSPHFLRCDGDRSPESNALRERLRRRIESGARRMPAPARAFVLLFALGDRRNLPTSLTQALRRLGLSHLLAVSGLHVGVVALVGLCLPIRSRMRELVALALVVAYVWWIGARPSLVRAAIMGVLAGGALLLKRPPAGINALACAVVVMVLVQPPIVADIGFQLSVAATAGILLFALPLARRWSRLHPVVSMPLSVTLSAQLCSLPWSVCHFHTLSPAAPIANLVAVPWMAVALIGSLAFAFIGSFAPHLAAGCAPLVAALIRPITWLARVPPSIAPIIPVSWSAGVTAIVAMSILRILWLSRPKWFALGVFLVLVLLGWPTTRRMSLEVLDVGQGEAVLLRDGSQVALVDGGGWRHGDFGGTVLLPILGREGIREIDRMIMSHADQDHCGGLVDLARYVPVNEILAAAHPRASPCWGRLKHLPGLRLRKLYPGDRIHIGDWRLEVLGPARAALSGNDRSLVVRILAGTTSVLLPGDVEAAGERALVSKWGEDGLRAEILVVPHHGSRTSSSDALLKAVRPAVAIISVGRHNPYGHPASSVLARLRRNRVRVLRTDRDGLIRVTPRPSPMRIDLPASPRLALEVR